MPRINIDDEFWDDRLGRHISLCSEVGEVMAVGMRLIAIRIAQKYWMDGRQLIPVEVFRRRKLDPLLKHDLAELRPTGVYVRGSEKHFSWYESAISNGKKGSNKRWGKNESEQNQIDTNRVAIGSPKGGHRGGIGCDRVRYHSPLPLPLPPDSEEEKNIVLSNERTRPTGVGHPRPDPEVLSIGKDFVAAWNEVTAGRLPAAIQLSKKRAEAIRVRFAERPDMDYWRSVFARLASSRFAREGKWAGIDWLLRNDTNHLKVSEGNYDDKPEVSQLRQRGERQRPESYGDGEPIVFPQAVLPHERKEN